MKENFGRIFWNYVEDTHDDPLYTVTTTQKLRNRKAIEHHQNGRKC